MRIGRFCRRWWRCRHFTGSFGSWLSGCEAHFGQSLVGYKDQPMLLKCTTLQIYQAFFRFYTSVTLRKATTFPPDNCWNKKVDSLGLPLINVARLPISCTSSTAQWFQVPPVSTITGNDVCADHTWQFCWPLPGWLLHMPLRRCPQCVILH